MSNHLVLHTRVTIGAGGGPEKTIVNSPCFLANQGFPMLCAYMRAPGDEDFDLLLDRASVTGATIIPVDDSGPFDWRIIQRFNAICREHRPSIWHGHDYKSNFVGLFANRAHPMRLITTVHGYVEKTLKLRLSYGLDRFVLRNYDHVICVSEDLHELMLERGLSPEKCTYVPNGIDIEEFRRTEPSDKAKERAGVAPGRLVFGAVGRLSPEKGFDLLIEAFQEAQARTKVDCELWIAGTGLEHGRLARMIEDLELGDRAKLLGFRSDLNELFHAMDGFILSSLREGIPNVVLEAMAYSVPMVCARVAGVPNVVDDEEQGLLVDCGSAPALVPALERLMADGKLRARLASSARTRVEQRHSFAHRMERVKEIYEQVLAAPA
jgi:glycosyltransferase involved in cell wall biosynthesis